MDDQQKNQPETARSEAAEDWPRCPWCSTPNPAGTEKCSSCGAALVSVAGSNERSIVGLTEVDPGLIEHEQWLRRLHEKRTDTNLLAQLFSPTTREEVPAYRTGEIDASAIQPPDEEVRREIARLEAAQAEARARGEANLRLAESLENEADATAASVPPALAASSQAASAREPAPPPEPSDASVERDAGPDGPASGTLPG